MEVKDVRLVSLLATGETIPGDGPSAAFQQALQRHSRVPSVLLVDGRGALPDLREPQDGPVVLLNADRVEVMDVLARLPLSAAIEKYALFAWWKVHREQPRGFWLHGHRRIVERMGADLVLSPLYSTKEICAFGSESLGLAELLARYLDAAG